MGRPGELHWGRPSEGVVSDDAGDLREGNYARQTVQEYVRVSVVQDTCPGVHLRLDVRPEVKGEPFEMDSGWGVSSAATVVRSLDTVGV